MQQRRQRDNGLPVLRQQAPILIMAPRIGCQHRHLRGQRAGSRSQIGPKPQTDSRGHGIAIQRQIIVRCQTDRLANRIDGGLQPDRIAHDPPAMTMRSTRTPCRSRSKTTFAAPSATAVTAAR